MSIQFDFSTLDSPQFRSILLAKLNEIIKSKLPTADSLNFDYSSNLELRSLNFFVESIGFGLKTPEVKIIDIQINPDNLQFASIKFDFSYSGDSSSSSDGAHLQISANVQGNPIAPKSLFNAFAMRSIRTLDSFSPAFVNLRVRIVSLELSGSISISTEFSSNSAVPDLLIEFHENPLKRFEIQSNLDGSTAGLTLRQTLQAQLAERIGGIIGKKIRIPMPQISTVQADQNNEINENVQENESRNSQSIDER